MACALNAQQKSREVCQAVSDALGIPGVKPATTLWRDLGLTKIARQHLHKPVKVRLTNRGCPPPATFTRASVADCITVGDIAAKAS